MQLAQRRADTGKVRARNEDAFLDLPQAGLWAVADGMGGHQNGALASRLIIEQLAELSRGGDLAERLRALRRCLHGLNRRLNRELTVTTERPDPVIGSTVVALLMESDRAACIWASDSRCYLWRSGRLYQLSRDHSLLQQLIDEQQLSPELAAKHPAAHALTRAIGANSWSWISSNSPYSRATRCCAAMGSTRACPPTRSAPHSACRPRSWRWNGCFVRHSRARRETISAPW